MRNYPYLDRIALSMDDQQMTDFARRVARRSLASPNVNQLLDMLSHLPSNVTSKTMSFLSDDYEEGTRMFEVRLYMRNNSIYDMDLDDLRDLINGWQSVATDWDDIEHYLYRHVGLRKCDECGEWELNTHTRTTWGSDDRVCRDCIDNNYRWSDRYDDYVHEEYVREAIDQNGRSCIIHEDDDDFHYDEDEETYVHIDYSPGSRLIGTYHSSKGHQRPIISPWTKARRRFIGVELEVETRDVSRTDKVQVLHKIINNEVWGSSVFFENDGSLNNGFEIISQPMGMDKHRELWSWLTDKDAIRGLRSHNTTTCGLHVHISRDTLSKLQVAKIVTFVNDPENEPLIRAVARRYAEGYCRIKTKKIGAAAQSEDRYEAVNITPRKTIEFRIFKGTLKYESLMAAIQFSNAVVDFCGRSTTSIRDLKSDQFLDFIRSDETGDFDLLVPYLDNRLETA